jgi:hypothetical protein
VPLEIPNVLIEIKNHWTGAALYTAEAETLKNAAEQAIKTGANLTKADLTEADLAGANLTGANLSEADLTRANLTMADLTEANLSCIREDFQLVLDSAPAEVVGLRLAVTEGRIDGSTYTGDCACLIGTIANVRQSDYYELPGIVPNDDRPAERWFLAIHRGDKPESSQIAAITLGWIDEWTADRREPKPVIDRASVVADASTDDGDRFPSEY